MELQELYRQGMSQSEIARRLTLDRKTVRTYLKEAPRGYPPRAPRPKRLDAFQVYLRERWEQGVHNAAKLLREIRGRGYPGGASQLRALVADWRVEQRERAYVRFETAPGEQSQLDWGHFGNWAGARLYALVLTLCWSRMLYIEFTQRQDIETLLSCLVRVFRRFFGGVTEVMLTDNMKAVVLERSDGVIQWNPRFLDFAAYYGFLPRVGD